MPGINVQLVRFGSFIVNVEALTYIGFDKNSAGEKRANLHLQDGNNLQFFNQLSPDTYRALEELREFVPTIQDVVELSKRIAKEEREAEEELREAEEDVEGFMETLAHVGPFGAYIMSMLEALGANGAPQSDSTEEKAEE